MQGLSLAREGAVHEPVYGIRRLNKIFLKNIGELMLPGREETHLQ